jgi:hypothetical protein
MDPEECQIRGMDTGEFPQDTYQGHHLYNQFDGLHIRWYPMIQLLHM